MSLLQTECINFPALFEHAPDLYLLLGVDFTILNASNAYLKATLTKRDEIIGRGLFEVFPDNPGDPLADGVSNLRASLNEVLDKNKPHKMPVQKYDISRPDGIFEVRYWSPLNTPVPGPDNKVQYIIHRVEDVTEQVNNEKLLALELQKGKYHEIAEELHKKDLLDSENRFSIIFNLCPVAIIKVRVNTGEIKRVNMAFEKLFLLDRHDVIGKTATELNVLSRQVLADITHRLFEHPADMLEMEFDVVISNGEKRNVLASFDIIEVDKQKNILVALMDITHRKQMEVALKEANSFLDTVLENIPNMVFVKDASSLKFLRFNKAGESLLGYNSEALLGKNDYDFFPQEQADFFVAKDREVLDSGKLLDIEEPIQTNKGERWLHTKKIPVAQNGNPVYLIGISEDITDKKRQQDAILELNKELDSFSYSVSHDLRAPLRAVTGFAEMLEADYASVLDEAGRRLLSRISANAARMGKLIDDLLAFSKLGRKEIQRKTIEMGALVSTVISDLMRAKVSEAKFVVHKLDNISGDKELMTQVLFNLLGNAVKYSSKKESPVIEITSQRSGNDVVYSIKDNGAGFDMKYADKLFGVFQRLHRVDEFEGTGVGLAIVQRIIKKHEGRVWAEGRLNEGATFYFSVPIL